MTDVIGGSGGFLLEERRLDVGGLAPTQALNDLAWALRHDDPERALSLAREAEALSRGDELGRALALRTIAHVERRRANHAVAHEAAADALAFFERVGDSVRSAQCLGILAQVYRADGDHAAAIRASGRALDLVRSAGDVSDQIQGLVDLSASYMHLGAFDEALGHLVEAHGLLPASGDPKRELVILSNIGYIRLERKQYTEALEEHRPALEIVERLGVKSMLGPVRLNVALDMLGLKCFEPAEALARSAVEAAHEVDDPSTLCKALGALAEALAGLERPGESLAVYEQAIEVATGARLHQEEARARVDLAKCCLGTGEFGRAEEELLQALSTARGVDARVEVRDAHCLLAEVLEQAEKPWPALEHLKAYQALEREIFTQASEDRQVALSVRFDTEKVRREAEVQRLRGEVAEAARVEAERANRAKSEFLSGMSHELRTPINAILGYSELIEEELLDRGQADLVPDHTRIQAAGKHLLSMINQVLDLARIEAGRLDLRVEAVGLGGLVEEALSLTRPLVTRNKLTLHEAVTFGGTVLADPEKLKQALVNLLSNAVKYNRDGGSVTVATAEQAGRVRVEVRDTGRGMSEDQMAKLFRPFERVGAENTKIEGTGLGLALTKRLVEAMGGEIGLTSQLGSGSTFYVSLPIASTVP